MLVFKKKKKKKKKGLYIFVSQDEMKDTPGDAAREAHEPNLLRMPKMHFSS